MTLAANIRQLTQPHPGITPNGKIATVKPLLEQLTDFIGTTGTTTSNEPPIPGSIKALSTYIQMERDAQDLNYQITGTDHGNLWAILKSWEPLKDDHWQPTLQEITSEWITQIHHHLNPPRERRPLRQPCAACNQRWAYDHDGKRIEALTAWVWDTHGEHIAPLNQWEIQCANCDAQWHGKEVIKAYWRART